MREHSQLFEYLKVCIFRDAWVAQLVERLPSAQVTIPVSHIGDMIESHIGLLAWWGACFSLCLCLPLCLLVLTLAPLSLTDK